MIAMPSGDEERIDALRDAVSRQAKKQEEIERRLLRIEERLGLVAGPRPAAASPVDVRPTGTEATGPAAAPPEAPARRTVFETRMGLTWVNRVGVVTLVLGMAFFFKYAVDLGWLGEAARVLVGAVSGLLLLAIGDRFWRRDQQTFAHGLSGAGIGILYLSFYAAFAFYRLLDQPATFLLMALNTAAAGALSFRYGASAIAVLGLIGGYLTPALLSSGVDRPWFLFTYVLLLNSGAIVLAHRRGWRALEVLAFLATIALYLSWLASFLRPEKHFVAYVFALLYYALFATRKIRGVFAAAQLAVTIELLLISLPQPWPFLPLAAMVVIAGLVIADRRGWPETPLAAFGGFWIPYATGHLALKAHGGAGLMLGFLTAVFFLFLAWTPWRVEIRGLAVRRQDLLLVALNAGAYFVCGYDLLDPRWLAWAGVFTLGLAALHAGIAHELREVFSRHAEADAAALYYGIAIALAVLAAPIQLTGFRITVAWALEAAALAWIGARTGERRLLPAALALGFLVLLRLWLVDSRMYRAPQEYLTLWNLRFLTFSAAAAGFWLAAWFLRRERAAPAPYLAGHAVLLWALILEVLGWAERYARPENLTSVRSTSVSILLAAYAVALVGLGVASRMAIHRVLGLALMAAVVVKLYLYDVWQIGRIYRVAAFAGLGLFLLLTSYLYSRFRGTIEGLWK